MPCINCHRCDSCPRPCNVEHQRLRLNKCYQSLTVEEKNTLTGMSYPACTTIWNSWSRVEQVNALKKHNIYARLGNVNTGNEYT